MIHPCTTSPMFVILPSVFPILSNQHQRVLSFPYHHTQPKWKSDESDIDFPRHFYAILERREGKRKVFHLNFLFTCNIPLDFAQLRHDKIFTSEDIFCEVLGD